MALYRYIVTQSDKELVLENEAVSDAVAYREGVRFAAELLAEQSSPGQTPIVFRLVVENADKRLIWRVDISAPVPPDVRP
ncbi:MULTISPECIES: DUF6894 family protein [unclassified Brevundimonas]|uniref:DUF6894 family protein n=1 Tax=unclassified Brevundimonas TaxID=2622653 RepID=UPI0025BF31B4|nr:MULTISPECIES: hypothetical protein [unclassified Brevundimonas]